MKVYRGYIRSEGQRFPVECGRDRSRWIVGVGVGVVVAVDVVDVVDVDVDVDVVVVVVMAVEGRQTDVEEQQQREDRGCRLDEAGGVSDNPSSLLSLLFLLPVFQHFFLLFSVPLRQNSGGETVGEEWIGFNEKNQNG